MLNAIIMIEENSCSVRFDPYTKGGLRFFVLIIRAVMLTLAGYPEIPMHHCSSEHRTLGTEPS